MAGVYSKIVSTPKQIDSIHTFIQGVRKDIVTAWTFVEGVRKQIFPSSEVYTEVFSKTTGGEYTTTLGYGKYKIVFSGGGGSGSSVALRKTESTSNRSQTNGSAGELITVNISIMSGETKTISGVIGTGGTGSSTSCTTSHAYITLGAAGTGYSNGLQGGQASFKVKGDAPGEEGYGAIAGGAGGGSTSVSIDGVILGIAKGGNGGGASLKNKIGFDSTTYSISGGAGGDGGVASGEGAAGGAASYGAGQHTPNTSGTGGTGYIYIYQSSVYPN